MKKRFFCNINIHYKDFFWGSTLRQFITGMCLFPFGNILFQLIVNELPIWYILLNNFDYFLGMFGLLSIVNGYAILSIICFLLSEILFIYIAYLVKISFIREFRFWIVGFGVIVITFFTIKNKLSKKE